MPNHSPSQSTEALPQWDAPKLEKLGAMQIVAGVKAGKTEKGPGKALNRLLS